MDLEDFFSLDCTDRCVIDIDTSLRPRYSCTIVYSCTNRWNVIDEEKDVGHGIKYLSNKLIESLDESNSNIWIWIGRRPRLNVVRSRHENHHVGLLG